MYFGIESTPTFMVLIPAVLFALFAQARVSSAYNKYAAVGNRKGCTGAQAARMILDQRGLTNVGIETGKGKLSDHYDPRKRVLKLSPDVHNGATIAAVSIAAHEAGHAIQHAQAYTPLTVRNAIVPVVNVASMLSWPLLVIGILVISAGQYVGGNLIFNIGILFFTAVVAFHTITLPVEFNASSRAMKQLKELGILYIEETHGAKKVLSAAAMTYVAALAVAVANLIRILLIRGRD